MTRHDKAKTMLSQALNGEVDQVPAPVRRGLSAAAYATDEYASNHDEALDALRRSVDRDMQALRESVDQLRKTLLSVGGSVIVLLVGSALGVFFTR